MGRVHGNVIELDAPVPELEGQRVRLVVEAVDETTTDAAALRQAWESWIARGADGPIADDEAPEFP